MRCPVCSEDNHAEREVCATCGVDLETGEVLPVAGGPAGSVRRSVLTSDGTVAVLHHVRDRVTIVLVVLVVTFGLVVAGLALTASGPFTPEVVLPPVPFAADEHPGEPVDLEMTFLEAPSDGPGDEALAMVDDDPRTSWTSPSIDDDEGLDVPIVIELAEPAWVSRLVVLNGDHRDADAHDLSGRVRRLILIMDGSRRIAVDLIDIGLAGQVIDLPEPELTTRIEIHIVEAATLGPTGGVTLAEIGVLGWIAGPDDRAVALSRRAIPRGTS